MDKKCSHCKLVKPIDQFNKHARYPDGLQLYCRECQKVSSSESSKRHREHRRIKLTEWRRANPEKYRAQKKRNYARHPEHAKTRAKRWRENNPERSLMKALQWPKKNPEKRKTIVKRYRKNHIEEKREKDRLAQKRRRNVPGTHTEEQWLKLCHRYGFICLRCKEHKELTKDHVFPIGHPNCTHNIENIQPLCSVCNSIKGHKVIDYR